jgi:hypothetical protein
MAQTLTSITPLLKYKYLPGFNSYVNSEQFILKYLEKNQQVIPVPYQFKVKIRTGYSEGHEMMTAPTDALATPRQATYKEATGTVKFLNGRIRVFTILQQLTKNNEFAALDAALDEMETIQESIKTDKERMAYGDAGVTQLATVSACTVSGQTMTITVDDTRYLRIGMPIDFLEANHSEITNGTDLTVATVDSPTQITVTAVATGGDLTTLVAALNDGALIYRANNYNKEYYGLESMFGSVTNTIFDVDRSTSAGSYIRPYVVRVNASGLIETGAATGTAKDWSLLNLHEVYEYLTDTKHADPNGLYGFCHSSVKSKIIQLKKAEGMTFNENEKIDGWPFSVVMFEGRPVLGHRYMKKNSFCWAPLNKMEKYENSKLDFVDFNGDIWQNVPNYAAFDAFLIETMEMGCSNFDQGGWIGDLKGAYES